MRRFGLPALLVLLLLGLAGVGFAAHDPNYCKLTDDTGTKLPPAPPVYGMSMSMRNEKNERMSAFEYFNGDIDKASLMAYTPDGTFRAIFDWTTKQIQVINMSDTGNLLGACTLQELISPDALTPVVLAGKMYFVPSKFFFGGGHIDAEYKGQEQIDGVTLDHYYACHYWKLSDMSMKIDWYFSRTGTIQPIRVVIEIQSNSEGKSIMRTTHDISYFGIGSPTWSARTNPFMAPPGLYCRNLNSQGHKPQTLPERFSMRIERIAQGSEATTYLKEAYDFNANMSLLLGYPPATSGDSRKYGAGKLLYIHDFRRQISYIRNEAMGNCTIERLTVPDWDSQKDGNQLRIRTPQQFFDLDSPNVQYKGSGYTRGIFTEVYINYKQINLGVQGLDVNTTIEWYFANKTTFDTHTQTYVTKSIPMSSMISSEATWLSSWLYIYDFEQKELVFNRHDISACFDKDGKQHYQLYFTLPNDNVAKYIRNNPNDFISLLVPLTAFGLHVSPLRLLDPEVTVSGWQAIIELTVTDRPNFLSDADETPLNEIEAAFNILISKQDIFTFLKVDGQEYTIYADSVIMVEERTNNLKSIGYSAGVLIGVGFAMVVLGLLVGTLVVFGIYKFRGGTLLGADPFRPQRM